jgi:IPT/TIG domain
MAVNNPAPSLTSISPTSVTADGAAFTLTATGSSFLSSSVVNVNGSARTTTYISPTQLQAAITAADIAYTGNLSITVTTPAPGGGPSASQTLTVTADIGVYCADFGATVVFGGATAQGIFDEPVNTGLSGQGFSGIPTTQPELRLPYNAFSPMPVLNQSITVDGVAFTVSYSSLQWNGLMYYYRLQAAS